MIFEERQVRNVLLQQGVEPFVASAVAGSLDGVMSSNVDIIPSDDGQFEEVQLGGIVSATKWPEVYGQLNKMPSSAIKFVEEMPTPSGRHVQFTIRVSEKPLSENDSETIVSNLRDRWGVQGDNTNIVQEIEEELLDDLPTEMDE